ncbi:hypothetical protein K466DRAFT_586266 [Polyporus arcularius HHB13444]|uniref:Uncharacterized protein n=1 Tax=Polyporus arcularius HHB13444 TaxID=1314778 RepID=A0A5C3PD70_9APHY|nr:hypothetical protein K466DRAFT_586266 [Polyporus arcularius HHB13444]
MNEDIFVLILYLCIPDVSLSPMDQDLRRTFLRTTSASQCCVSSTPPHLAELQTQDSCDPQRDARVPPDRYHRLFGVSK